EETRSTGANPIVSIEFCIVRSYLPRHLHQWKQSLGLPATPPVRPPIRLAMPGPLLSASVWRTQSADDDRTIQNSIETIGFAPVLRVSSDSIQSHAAGISPARLRSRSSDRGRALYSIRFSAIGGTSQPR